MRKGSKRLLGGRHPRRDRVRGLAGVAGAGPRRHRATSSGRRRRSPSRRCRARPRVAEPRSPTRRSPRRSRAFVEPGADGACPATHPVKAKLASGIYHVPGGGNYERTKPDRCYVDAAAAEADGLRAAKR